MSKVIDERIVEMRFDNQDFERNADQSIRTLDEIDDRISNLTGDGFLSGLQNGINNIPILGSIVNGIESLGGTIRSKLGSIMDLVVADTILKLKTNFERTAIDLTLGQLDAGWSKYGQKTSAVQTIISATRKEGETMEEALERVNKQVERLNWFSDETSYSFTDMVSNVGKFTSMGIELDQAATAMMGISNWAAKSGANSQEASRAMYNLSQAMGVGALKLQDWKSIQNANMATKEFKETVIETAVSLGVLVKDSEGVAHRVDDTGKAIANATVTAEQFDETLRHEWINKDVLMATLEKYGAYSDAVYKVSDAYDTCAEAMQHVSEDGMELGASAFKAAQEAKTLEEAIDATKDAVSTAWLNIFETLFGDYLEAKELWTDLSQFLWEVFAYPVTKINEVADLIVSLGGMNDILSSLKYSWEAIDAIVSTVKDTFLVVFSTTYNFSEFGVSIGWEIDKVIEKFRAFVYLLKESIIKEQTLERIGNAAKSIIAPFNLLKTVIMKLYDAFTKRFLRSIQGISETILDISSGFGEFVNSIVDAILKTDIFDNIIDGLFTTITKLSDGISIVYNFLKETTVWEVLKTVGSSVINVLIDIADGFSQIFKSSGPVFSVIDKFSNKLSTLTKNANGPFEKLWEIIKAIFGYIKKYASEIKLPTEKISNFIDSIEEFAGRLKEIFSDSLSGISDEINKEGDKLADSVGKQSGFNKFLNGLEEFAGKTSTSLSNIPKDAIKDMSPLLQFLALISGEVTEIGMTGIAGTTVIGSLVAILLMISKVTNAVSNLLSAPERLMEMPERLINKGTAMITAAEKFVTKIEEGALSDPLKILMGPFNKQGVASIIESVGKAFLELAAGLTLLALIPSEKLASVTGSLAILLGEMAGFSSALAITLTALSKSATTKTFIKMDTTIAAIAGFVTALGATMLTLSMSTYILDKCDNMAAGIIALMAVMVEIVGFIYVIRSMKVTLDDIEKILALTGAINVLAIAVSVLSGASVLFALSNEQAGIMSALFALTMLTAVVYILSKISASSLDIASVLAFSGAMVIISSAMVVLSVAALMFKNVDEEALTKMGLVLLGLTTAIGALVGLSNLVTIEQVLSLLPLLVSLTAILGVMGIAINAMKKVDASTIGAFAAAIGVMIGAITLLGILGAVLSKAGPTALASIGIVAALVLAIGTLMMAAAMAASAIFSAISLFESVDIAAVRDNILIYLTTILEGVAEFLKNVSHIVMGAIIDELVLMMTSSVNLFSLVIDQFYDALISSIPQIFHFIQIFTNNLTIYKGLIEQLITNIKDIIIMVLTAIVEIVIALIDLLLGYLENKAEEYGIAAANIVASFVTGFFNALADNQDDMISAAFKFVGSFMEACNEKVKAEGPKLASTGVEIAKNMIITMFTGQEIFDTIKTSVKEVAKNITAGLVDAFKGKNSSDLKDLGTSMSKAVRSGFEEDSQIHSPSKIYYEYGDNIGKSLLNSLTNSTSEMPSALEELKKSFTNGITNTFDDEISSPVVKPILDMSNLENGVGSISEMFGDYNLTDVNAGKINSMFENLQKKQATDNEYFEQMKTDYMTNGGEKDINLNVTLEGDAGKFFKAMQTENIIYQKKTGRSAF